MMKDILRGLCLALYLGLAALYVGAAEPDFAFPRKVESAARTELQRALKRGDGQATVQALVKIGLASSAISTDSLPSYLAQLQKVASQEPQPEIKALLSALQAQIYVQIFQANSYVYAQRADVAQPTDDYSLWGRGDFLRKVSQLTAQSLSEPQTLKARPLSEFANIITQDRAADILYPSLLDFLALRGIENLQAFDAGQHILPQALLNTPDDVRLFPSPMCAPLRQMLEIYSLWAQEASHPAGRVNANIQRLQFIAAHVFEPQPNLLQATLISRYRANASDPYAVEYLLAANMPEIGTKECHQMYAWLQAFVKANPLYYNLNAVSNRLAQLSAPSAELRLPGVAALGASLKIEVTATNAKHTTVEIYDITDRLGNDNTDRYNIDRGLPDGPKISVSFTTDSVVPFKRTFSDKVYLPGYGKYVAVMRVAGATERRSCPVVCCTDLYGGSAASQGSAMAWVVNPASGEPQKGVKLGIRPTNSKVYTPLSGTTSKLGLMALDISTDAWLQPRRGDDRAARAWYFAPQSEPRNAERLSARMFTSLGLYHPGDSMAFALTAFTTGLSGNQIAADKTIDVMLYNANYVPIDTLRLTTDSWGRADGQFLLPTSGLQGEFTLEARPSASDGPVIGSCAFMVSDYQLPTFEVTQQRVARPTSAADSCVIYGSATAFSGFPIAQAQVSAQISCRAGLWPWSPQSAPFATATTTTNLQGDFRLVIPADILASAPTRRGVFKAQIDVTSADGETQSLPVQFTVGSPRAINVQIPNTVNAAEPFEALAVVTDAEGDTIACTLRYKISGSNFSHTFTVKEGEVNAGSLQGLLSPLPSGCYEMELTAQDAEPVSSSFILYRPSDSVSPCKDLLWNIGATPVIASANGEAVLNFEVGGDSLWVLVVTADAHGRRIGNDWLRPASGYNSLELQLPRQADGSYAAATANMFTVKDGRTCQVQFNIAPPHAQKALKLEIETFRDHVVPGATEQLSLRVVPVDGATPLSALMLDMSSRAIDVLAANPMEMWLPQPSLLTPSFNYPWLGATTLYCGASPKLLPETAMQQPEFNLYGQSFFPRRFMGNHLLGAARGGVGPRMLNTMAKMAAPQMATQEVMADAAAPEASNDNDAVKEAPTSAPVESAQDEHYHPSEIPLAFFRPRLETDTTGTLSVHYTVPDANTTWLLRALAYNRELLTATTQASIVASKPVMVNLNAPRFLRYGDKVHLQASVMNNTDSVASLRAVAQVVNPVNGDVLATDTVAVDSLGPRMATTVGLEFNADCLLPTVAFRLRASGQGYADGEQDLMPILTSDQEVVSSEMFYIPAGQSHFQMPLPQAAEGDRVMLDFTENPTWQVLSALPGLREMRLKSSPEAASALFSAVVAAELVRSNPEVVRALRRWAENPADSALVSPLQRNEQLKQILLGDTPWLQAAMSQTERMQRLALLLDRRQAQQVIEKAMTVLAKTQTGGGGWCWTEQYPQPSQWCTTRVLDLLGQLNAMGLLPGDAQLKTLISNGVAYLDAEAVRDFQRTPKADFRQYALVRGMFPGVRQSSAAARVTASTVQRVIGSWRSDAVAMKGVDAMILQANGYEATARQILASLREYATSTPEKGMWWQQLEALPAGWSMAKVGATALLLNAFVSLEPASPDVDRIRQWLLLQKVNNDWGSSATTTAVVAAILRSGTNWLVNARGTAIRLGDTLVEPTATQLAVGSFTVPVATPISAGEQLTIDRQASYPSMGSVMSFRRQPMAAIEAEPCSEASVEKELTVLRGTQWTVADTLRVGDRVRVRLTLRADSDLGYVVISDPRAACLQPAEQLPTPIYAEGLCFYRENGDSQTTIFIDRLPRGVYTLTYDMLVAQAGTFASGAAALQSQYNPAIAAHSAAAPHIVR